MAAKLAHDHVGQLGDRGPHLVGAGIELCGVYTHMRNEGHSVGPQAAHALVDAGLRHLGQCVAAGNHMVPKHHAFVHLLEQAFDHGNPRTFSTYTDESLNGALAIVSHNASVAKLSETLLRKSELDINACV